MNPRVLFWPRNALGEGGFCVAIGSNEPVGRACPCADKHEGEASACRPLGPWIVASTVVRRWGKEPELTPYPPESP